jgi:hypothetical protein
LNLNNLDDTTIQQIHQHLNVINNLTKLTHNLNEYQLIINKEEAGKKCIRPQLRFSSNYYASRWHTPQNRTDLAKEKIAQS